MNLRKKKHLAKEGVGGRGGTTKQKKTWKHYEVTATFQLCCTDKKKAGHRHEKGRNLQSCPRQISLVCHFHGAHPATKNKNTIDETISILVCIIGYKTSSEQEKNMPRPLPSQLWGLSLHLLFLQLTQPLLHCCEDKNPLLVSPLHDAQEVSPVLQWHDQYCTSCLNALCRMKD